MGTGTLSFWGTGKSDSIHCITLDPQMKRSPKSRLINPFRLVYYVYTLNVVLPVLSISLSLSLAHTHSLSLSLHVQLGSCISPLQSMDADSVALVHIWCPWCSGRRRQGRKETKAKAESQEDALSSTWSCSQCIHYCCDCDHYHSVYHNILFERVQYHHTLYSFVIVTKMQVKGGVYNKTS